jgi:hypothetical protein
MPTGYPDYANSFVGPVAVADGGTGQASFIAAKLMQVVTQLDATVQAGNVPTSDIFIAPATGQYRLTGNVFNRGTVATSSLAVTIGWTQNGVAKTNTTAFSYTNQGNNYSQDAIISMYADSGSHITYAITYTTGGFPDSYDFHFSLERMS